MATLRYPRITWGTSFANTWSFALPLDSAVAYSNLYEDSEFIMAPSGIEDSWAPSTEWYVLSGEVRRVPPSTVVIGSLTQTGWEGSTGVRAALQWARRKNQLRFYPDYLSGTYITCYLAEPMEGGVSLEDDGNRRFNLVLRNTATEFTGY